MLNRKTLALICAALAGTVAALLFAAGASYGSSEPAVRGAACSHVGEHRNNRSGTEYVCEQRPGDPCPLWHAAHPSKGPWPKPSPCECPSKPASSPPTTRPSMSHSPAPHTTASLASPATPATTPVAGQLPVTGTPEVVGIAGVALFLVGAGALLIVVPRIARRRNN